MNRLLLVLLIAASSTLAEEGPASSDGVLAKGAPYIKRLLPVTLNGGKLALDRGAWEKNKESEAEVEAKKKKMAEQMGIPVEQVARFGGMGMGGGIVPGDLFQDVMNAAGGGYFGGGASSSGSHHQWSSDRGVVSGSLSLDMEQKVFDLKLAEKGGRSLSVSDEKGMGFTIHYSNPARESGFVFLQAPSGPASLAGYRGKEGVALSGENFVQLLRKDSKKVQEFFLKPLAQMGIDFPCSREHTAVKAIVTTGFSKSAPEVAAKVDALIAKLNNDDMDTREQATKDLTALYPQAVGQISKSMDEAQDPELKSRLEAVASAYPQMVMAREYVLIEKLHEDRAYLLELLADPTYKAGAHARLTELYGKDYGDDRSAWPKP